MPPHRDQVRRTLALYRDQPATRRASIRIRRMLLPLLEVDRELPSEGEILDLACGWGFLSSFLALCSAGRRVTGIDLDPVRVETVNNATRALPNVGFAQGDISQFEQRDLDGVLLIDSLHYFPEATQSALLARIARALRPGGRLLLRDVVRQAGPRFWWNWFHEWAMVGGGLTATRSGKLFFLPLARLRSMIEQAGLVIDRIYPMPAWRPYTDTLIVATKER